MFVNSSGYLVDYDVSIRFQIDRIMENYLRLETNKIEGGMAEIDNSLEANLLALVEVANNLLDAKATYRDTVNGELVEIPSLRTNREALSCFARWLSDEKKGRTTNFNSPPGPSPKTANGVPTPRTNTFV